MALNIFLGLFVYSAVMLAAMIAFRIFEVKKGRVRIPSEPAPFLNTQQVWRIIYQLEQELPIRLHNLLYLRARTACESLGKRVHQHHLTKRLLSGISAINRNRNYKHRMTPARANREMHRSVMGEREEQEDASLFFHAVSEHKKKIRQENGFKKD